VPDLLDHLRAAFSPTSPVSFDRRFDEVRRAPFLVLDDLGTESATPWAREKMYQIFDYRYNARLPTIITAATPIKDLDPRLAARIQDETRCIHFAILAPAYRGKRSGAPADLRPAAHRSRRVTVQPIEIVLPWALRASCGPPPTNLICVSRYVPVAQAARPVCRLTAGAAVICKPMPGGTMPSIVAITGAAGYIGGRLLTRLLQESDVEVIVGIDVNPLPDAHGHFIPCQQDIRAPSLAETLTRYQVDTLVHTAFVLFPPPRRLREMAEINVGGTENVLRAAVQAGVHHVIFLSSTTVYGAWPDNPLPLTEEHPPRPNPDYPYAVHKAQAEALVRRFGEEHPNRVWTILRPPGVVGPHFRAPWRAFSAPPAALS
jgi:replicative DNA helicase loader DnaI